MSKIFATIKKEFLRLIPPTLFFIVTLNLVALVRSLMLHGTGIHVGSWIAMTVSALLLGKAVLIVDLLPFIKRYHNRPLIYSIIWKTAIYLVAATFIHYCEDLYGAWGKTASLADANSKLLTEMVWPQFWAIHIFMAVLIFMYCTVRELVRALGADKARHLFFGTSAGG